MKLLRIIAYPFSILYGLVLMLRNKFYDWGIFKSVRFHLPVISVGNLSVGGTGKTPHIEYLIRLLRPDYQTATLSRGYGRKTRGFLLSDTSTTAADMGDEPLQFKTRHPDIAVAVDEKRVRGIKKLLELFPETQVVLLDDAFQHRAVNPGLSIVLTDFSKPYFEDHILPAGTLREFRAGIKRADIIIVSILYSNKNNLTAPSGILCCPDSHRAMVRPETSSCRASCASDSPRVLRLSFSSPPVIPAPPVLDPPLHTEAHRAGSRLPRLARRSPIGPYLTSPGLPYRPDRALPDHIIPRRAEPDHCKPALPFRTGPLRALPSHAVPAAPNLAKTDLANPHPTCQITRVFCALPDQSRRTPAPTPTTSHIRAAMPSTRAGISPANSRVSAGRSLP